MSKQKEAFKIALPYTLPIAAGFLFLGTSLGIFMTGKGFPFYYPILISATVFAGSMEFVLVEILTLPFAPITTFFLALMINARHIFYGLSMLEKFKNTGWKKKFLIFFMCDESFSINSSIGTSIKLDEKKDISWFMLHVSWLNYIYWVSGVIIGSVLGKYIPFNTKGIDFVLTALFLVIFVEQWKSTKNHVPALTGLSISFIALLIFGKEYFIIISMIGILLAYYFLYKIEIKKEKGNE